MELARALSVLAIVAGATGCPDEPAHCETPCVLPEICTPLGYSDVESEGVVHRCLQPCDDLVGDDNCPATHACVRSCFEPDVAFCGKRRERAPCAEQGDETSVAGEVGAVCRVDDDCSEGSRCGAEHRCREDLCDSDSCADGATCVSAELDGVFCGSTCAEPVARGETCTLTNPFEGCRLELPCAEGLQCDEVCTGE